MIHNRIVFRLCDSNFSENLQLEADHTLEKAVTSAHQRLSVKKQHKVVKAENSLSTTDALLSLGKKDKPVGSTWANIKAIAQNNHLPVTSTDT